MQEIDPEEIAKMKAVNEEMKAKMNTVKEEMEAKIRAEISKPNRFCKDKQTEIPKMGCMFCCYGHMISCHFPYTCSQAGCYDENNNKTAIATNEEGELFFGVN